MDRKIKVTGNGQATCSPDHVIVSLVIEGRDKKYAQAVEKAEVQLRWLNSGLASVGFEPDAAKTLAFRVKENFVPDRNHLMKADGYVCTHQVKIEFDFDSEKLTRVLSVVTSGFAEPRINVEFTMKDKMVLQELALLDAGRNAHRKAEALCAAVGAQLGQLISVESESSHFRDIPLPVMAQSRTAQVSPAAPTVELQPEDISVTASAVYVWEIQ